MKAARILIAASKAVLPQLRTALTGYELCETTTIEQAKRLTWEDGINLFVIGVDFDDSQAMDLVKFIRLDPKHKGTPILVIRESPSTMADFIRHTMETMKSFRVISDYLEIEGDLNADVKIKNAVTECLQNETLCQSKIST